jgi:hypothetical protein
MIWNLPQRCGMSANLKELASEVRAVGRFNCETYLPGGDISYVTRAAPSNGGPAERLATTNPHRFGRPRFLSFVSFV